MKGSELGSRGRRTRFAALSRDRRPGRVALLGALALASFLVVFDDSALSVALPTLQEDLGLNMGQLEWTLNAYTLGLAVVLLLAGKLVDRHGARRVLIVGLVLFTAASLPAGLAQGGNVLIVARAVQGAGAGFIAPASLAIVSALFPATRRGVAIGVWAGVSAIGLGAGPLLGAVIVESFGWGGIFLLNLPLGAMLIAVSLSSAVETPVKNSKTRLDIAGAAAAATTLLLALLALTWGNTAAWLSPPVLLLGAGTLASGIVFVALEARADDPVVPLGVFRSRALVGATTVGLFSTAAMCSLFFFMSLYLQSVAGYSVLATGAVFLPMTAVIAFGSPLAGWMSGRVAPRALAGTGMALLSLALLVLSSIDRGVGLGWVVLGLTLAGTGIALTTTPVTSVALAAFPLDQQGIASALVSTARTVGLALGVAVMGAILGESTAARLTERLSFGLELNAAVAATGAVIAIWLFAPPRRHELTALTHVCGKTESGA